MRIRSAEGDSDRRLANRGPLVKVAYFVAVVVGWAFLATTIGAIALHFLPGRGRVSTAVTSAVPLLLLAGIAALVVLAFTRRWITVGLTVIALGVGAWTQAPLFHASDDPGGARITVVQSNIKLGAGDVGAVAATVVSSDAQILTVEEMTPDALARIHATDIRRVLPYEFVAPGIGGVGTGIFSKFPLRNTAQLADYALNNLRADVDLPGAPNTTVFAVHPIPPYPYDPARWVREMQRLRETVHESSARTVIVSGDFNSTWDHAQFRSLLSDGFHDATEQAGAGWQFTYPANRFYGPVIGIDHLVSRGFTAVSLHTVDVDRSDHRALVTSLAVS